MTTAAALYILATICTTQTDCEVREYPTEATGPIACMMTGQQVLASHLLPGEHIRRWRCVQGRGA